MKILVRSYAMLNVGDDLFLCSLFERYPHVDFEFSMIPELVSYYEKFEESYKNAKINNKKSLVRRLKNKFNIISADKKILKQYDAVVYIAGSIFMENCSNYDFQTLLEKEVNYLNSKKIPSFFLSCNFGPYYTQKFIKRNDKMFRKCTDVCFREKYSYDIFKHLKNVRVAPDAVFSLHLPEVEVKPKTLGISVINLDIRPKLKQFKLEYQRLIIRIAKEYIQKGYDIYFFSFCQYEQDGIAIVEIAKLLKDEGIRENLHTFMYDGEIWSFVRQYLSMEKTVCSRFHSMILSIVSKKEFLPIVSSSKMSNVINDLNLCEHYLNVDEADGDIGMNPPIDAAKISEQAQEVFFELDKLLMSDYM
ncbi:MAG: polysaccharide pyruvyl transferase family protein [Clostridia bacterium]|nr:polysaccharide pyruvyl transferase family protein [Clostridia bacterium]